MTGYDVISNLDGKVICGARGEGVGAVARGHKSTCLAVYIKFYILQLLLLNLRTRGTF